MLRTTHELKAPFAAIAANAQLLLRGNCGTLPEEAAEVVRRIAARCRRLAVEIQEMLQLANLQSSEERPERVRLDVAEIVRWAIARVGATAQERRVIVDEGLSPAHVVAVEDHQDAVGNIIANAVVIHRGRTVRVRWADTPEGPIDREDEESDRREKLPRLRRLLPHRGGRAAQQGFNRTRAGIAARRPGHGIRLESSAPGRGTRFTLRFPFAEGSRGNGEVMSYL
jgi:signal transduction histidine kinase